MPHRPHVSAALAVFLAAALLPARPVAADDQGGERAEQLEAIEAAAQEAAAKAAALAEEAAGLRQEIAALTEESIAVAARLQALEGELSSVEGTLEALESELAAREAALAAERTTLSRTLAALVRIALQPPEAMLARQGAPLDMVRSAMLLSVAVPELESRAAALAADLSELEALKGQIAGENAVASSTRAALEAERQRLEVLLARKESLAAMTAAEQASAAAEQARLAEEAEDLKALIAELERQAAERARAEAEAQAAAAQAAAAQAAAEQAAAEQAAAEQAAAEQGAAEEAAAGTAPQAPQVASVAPGTLRDFPSQPGGLFLPAAGQLAAGYGDPLPDGSDSSKGFLIETRPGAQIVATFDGRIVYAGAFRRYGLILIIEHSGRYHSLLAGLGRIDVVLGQWVVAGEPVGLMGSPAGEAPVLYLELRHNGQPIDPRPWFATQLTKGEG